MLRSRIVGLRLCLVATVNTGLRFNARTDVSGRRGRMAHGHAVAFQYAGCGTSPHPREGETRNSACHDDLATLLLKCIRVEQLLCPLTPRESKRDRNPFLDAHLHRFRSDWEIWAGNDCSRFSPRTDFRCRHTHSANCTVVLTVASRLSVRVRNQVLASAGGRGAVTTPSATDASMLVQSRFDRGPTSAV